MPAVVQVPTTVEQLDQVRSLMRAFIVWHKARHREDIHLIDAYFDAGAFEQELASLPGQVRPSARSVAPRHNGGNACWLCGASRNRFRFL